MKYFWLFPFLLLGCGDQNELSWERFHGQTMGTSFNITYERPSKVKKVKLESEIQMLLKEFDGLMSNWNLQSWVTKFNQNEGTDWQEVDPSVMKILQIAKNINVQSEGRFDVTISPLIEWWGFGVEERESDRDQSKLETLKGKIGMDKLELDAPGKKIKKNRPELQINCSALAKGFGVDLVSEFLLGQGVNNFLVEIGGETRVKGSPQKRDVWLLGVQRPDSSGDPIFAKVRMEDGLSLATSGDYLNSFREDGQRINHIIDPITGKPTNHQLTSVSVSGKNCAEVDALATACMVLGEKKGMELIEKLEGFEGFFIIRSPEGYNTLKSSGFPLLETP